MCQMMVSEVGRTISGSSSFALGIGLDAALPSADRRAQAVVGDDRALLGEALDVLASLRSGSSSGMNSGK
jgi:hypothetical protein